MDIGLSGVLDLSALLQHFSIKEVVEVSHFENSWPPNNWQKVRASFRGIVQPSLWAKMWITISPAVRLVVQFQRMLYCVHYTTVLNY